MSGQEISIHKRQTYALVCETLKYRPVIDEILEAAGLQALLKRGNKFLVYVLVYDLLFGQGIKGGGAVKRLIAEHQGELKKALVRLKVRRRVMRNEELLPQAPLALPRYARVNTLKTSTQQALQALDGLQVRQDVHIPNLLGFPPGTDLHEHPLVTSGALILQEKSSCFPAAILAASGADDGGDAVDACAAPGNKTSHLAMLRANRGKIFAFDKSPSRLEVLRQRMLDAGADSVIPALQDFLTVNPADPQYAKVTSILLDPSCSGSGMANRLDHFLDAGGGENDGKGSGEGPSRSDRLKALADFQLAALCKAFSFPQVQRVTYSTCSIYQEENEQVVAAVLAKQRTGQITCDTPFELKKCLPTWQRRGQQVPGLTAAEADCLVRVDPNIDSASGFFVALFQRRKKGDSTALEKEPRQLKETPPSMEQKKRAVGVEEDSSGDRKGKEKKKRRKKGKKAEERATM